MRKVFYIFLAHIVVLGSLWIYNVSRDSHEPMVKEGYEQVLFPGYIKAGSSGLEMFICIDRERIDDLAQGSPLGMAMSAKVLDNDMVQDMSGRQKGRVCYSILFDGSGSECSIYEQH